MHEVGEEELWSLINGIKNKKAPGLGNLRGKLLKRILREKIACSFLLKNLSGSHSSIKNYRPITLLPEYSKVFEKIIRFRMMEKRADFHSDRQLGRANVRRMHSGSI